MNTYGELKSLINNIKTKQKAGKIIAKGKEVAITQILGLIPGASNAKTAFDFIRTAFEKPDTVKTNTWLDKLDVDDDMSAIVDDTVENGFLETIAKTIDSHPDDKPLEDDFNMNQEMVDFLKSKYSGRTVTGINEFDMKERWQKLAGITEINMASKADQESPPPESSGELEGAGLQKLKGLLGDIAPDVDSSKAGLALNNLFNNKTLSISQKDILIDVLKGMLKTKDVEKVKAVLAATKEK